MPHYVVANFTHDARPSGAWRRLLGILRELPHRLTATESVTLLVNADAPPPELPEAIRIIPIAIPRHPTWRRAHAEAKLLPAIVRELDANVLDMSTLPVPVGLSCPLALTLHDLRDLVPGLARRARFITRHVLRRAVSRTTRLIVPSPFTASELDRHLRDEHPPIEVIGGGLDPQWFHRTRGTDSESSPTENWFLHVGHLERRKNVGVLLDALHILSRTGRSRELGIPILEMVGRDQGDGPSLRSRAHQLGLDEYLRWRGEVDERELIRLYRGARAVLFPSRYEGLGIPAFEALALGAPLIVASGTATAGLVDGHAEVIPPTDAAAWADAMARALAVRPNEDVRSAAIAFARCHGSDQAAYRVLEVWRSITR